jgi:hypothetical protein
MSQEAEPVRIVLTPEQRELVHRMSGQHIEAIELESDEPDKPSGVLRFLWRRSASTGIPRQQWVSDDETRDASTNAASS